MLEDTGEDGDGAAKNVGSHDVDDDEERNVEVAQSSTPFTGITAFCVTFRKTGSELISQCE